MKKMNKKGFTIVELVIVIAVIAILAAVMIPTFSSVVNNAKKSAAIQEIKAAYTETLSYFLSNDISTDDSALDAKFLVEYESFTLVVDKGVVEVYDSTTHGTVTLKSTYTPSTGRLSIPAA